MFLGNLCSVLMVTENGPLKWALLSAGGNHSKNFKNIVPLFLIEDNISFFSLIQSLMYFMMYCDFSFYPMILTMPSHTAIRLFLPEPRKLFSSREAVIHLWFTTQSIVPQHCWHVLHWQLRYESFFRVFLILSACSDSVMGWGKLFCGGTVTYGECSQCGTKIHFP